MDGDHDRRDTALLGVDGYKAFLVKRRESIAARLNGFLGVPAGSISPVPPNQSANQEGSV
jgi:hypothetical protein